MLKNYFKLAFRNLIHNKTYSLINIISFSIGLAAVLLIALYIKFEMSFDNYHQDANRIYRLISIYESEHHTFGFTKKLGVKRSHSVGAPYNYSPLMYKENPDIDLAVRIYKNTSDLSQIMIKKDEQFFQEPETFAADEDLFNLFSWKLLRGNPETVLSNPYSVVLTQSKAQKYFGEPFPVGKILSVRKDDKIHDLIVTGIMADVPYNSHIRPEIICPVSLLDPGKKLRCPWETAYSALYFKLKQNADVGKVANEISEMQNRGLAVKGINYLQALKDIRFNSGQIQHDFAQTGNIEIIIIFSAIGLLILMIAGFNFIILSTARSSTRIKEIGIRKVIGANRFGLIKQLLAESIVLAFIALPLAIILIEVAIPTFNTFLNTHIALNFLGDIQFFTLFTGLTLLVGILAGLYVAVYLSAFQPIQILTGNIFYGSSKSLFRKILLGTQLIIFIGLTGFTVVVSQQIRHTQSAKTLGYEKDHLIFIDINDVVFRKKYQVYKTNILKNSGIINVSASSSKLPDKPGKASMLTLGKGGKVSGVGYNQFYIDFDYFETVGIELGAGRKFSREFPADLECKNIILNETAIKQLGGMEMVGKKMYKDRSSTIIGVVKDFHMESFHKKIEPTIFYATLDYDLKQIVLRIENQHVAKTLAFLEKEWQKLAPDDPFIFHFADDTIDALYRAEQNFGKMIGLSAMFAVIVAALGLFGLTAFSAERRIKEISIRKVLGASEVSIINLLTGEYFVLVIISGVLAWPVAYFAIEKWLQNFAYRIEMTAWPFLGAALAALVIAMFSVGWQAVRAATKNPVEALRYE